jgi:Phosphorylase superfamily
VVAASKIHCYEVGKAKKDFMQRPDTFQTSHAMESRAKVEANNIRWLNRVGQFDKNDPPRAMVGPIVAGEKVVASKDSAVYKFIEKHYSDALAVEMEGHGFLTAARAHPRVHALVVRGISDTINDKSGQTDPARQATASRHAAAFAFEVLSRFQTFRAKDYTHDRGASISSPPSAEHQRSHSDFSGTWRGAWQSISAKREHKATLVIPTGHSDKFTATMVVTFTRSGQQTTILETLNGRVDKNCLQLTGAKFDYVQQGSSSSYSLDSFELRLENNEKRLVGNAILKNGQREVEFDK